MERKKDRSLKPTIKAIIFDMDGVISDTQVAHAKTESELLKSHGIEIHPDEITRQYAGMAGKDMFEDVFRNAGKHLPSLEDLIKKKREMLSVSLAGNVKEILGTREFIQRLKQYDLPLAVASASRLSFIEMILSELNLRNEFHAIASSEEVKRGKPEPDVFLLAAQRIFVLPEECVVIEDSMNGMIAAKRAGMQCIGLVQDENAQDYPADLLVKDLREVAIDKYIHS